MEGERWGQAGICYPEDIRLLNLVEKTRKM